MARRYWIAAYDEVKTSLDPRDNISVDWSPALKKHIVLRGSVMVDQFDDRAEAFGAARRLADKA